MRSGCLLVTVLAFSMAALPGSAETKHSAKKPAKAKAAVQQTAQPATPPPPPPTLEQQPAQPPQVAFDSGQLTITAPNSTLADILRLVHKQTGAAVDIPANANERVVGNFGPGPARDVLASLLNGSHFNYVLLGSEGNPTALDRVMLMAKTGGALSAPSNPGEQAGVPEPPQGAPVPAQIAPQTQAQNGNVGPGAVGNGEDTQEVSNDEFDDSGDADAQPSDNDANGGDEQIQGQPGQQNARTPEQLLQELQQRQQQIQQQQQGLPPGAPLPPGAAPPQQPPPPGQPPQ